MAISTLISERNRFRAVTIGLLPLGMVFPGKAWGQEITLEVEFVGGGSSLDFGRLRNLEADGTPAHDSATRHVRLIIQPEQGSQRAYVVTQVLQGELANESGEFFPEESIVYRVQEETGSGTVRVPDQTPVRTGEEEIYRSASGGGAAQLLLSYDLIAAPDQEAGSYHGNVVYRVSTL